MLFQLLRLQPPTAFVRPVDKQRAAFGGSKGGGLTRRSARAGCLPSCLRSLGAPPLGSSCTRVGAQYAASSLHPFLRQATRAGPDGEIWTAIKILELHRIRLKRADSPPARSRRGPEAPEALKTAGFFLGSLARAQSQETGGVGRRPSSPPHATPADSPARLEGAE